jgi:SAM-dependent methyltransferase
MARGGAAAWDGDRYQARFDALAASGAEVHGEADLVASYDPAVVLDAGCGTGRVAVELARRGVEVVGIDLDPSMLGVARAAAPHLDWRPGDLATVELEPTRFDLVVLAGNVLLFTAPGTEAAVVANLATALRPGGRLVAGFSLHPGGYGLDAYDEAAAAARLELEDRWATWDRALFHGGDYAVSVHRRPA